MAKQTVLLAFISFALFHIGKSTLLIEAPKDDTVPLKCETRPPTNLEKYTLDVKRVDGNSSYPAGVIYSRRNMKENVFPQLEQYRNRVLLINEDLRRGFMTVLIQSVQQSDSGLYKSYIPKLNTTCFFTVVVKEKQNWTKENDTSTRAALTEEVPDADAATEKHHRYHYAVIPVFALFIAAVFLMFFMKRICKTFKRKSEGKDFELETQAKKGDEEEQLKKPSAV